MSDRRQPGGDWFDEPGAARLPPRRARRAAPQTPGGRRLVPAGRVLVAVLIGSALALLLNAASIERGARALPFGAQRTVAVAVMRPVAALSHFLFLDRPSRAVASLLGRRASETDARAALTDLGKPTGAAAPGVLRTPTPERPLRIWVGGDSMAQTTGAQVVQLARETGVMKATLDYHISTGLSRPDYYDWPRRLRFIARTVQPDVDVAFFGANDGQSVSYDGEVLALGSPTWMELYHERVAAAMELLSRGGATRVYWVGLPIMRAAAYRRTARMLDEVARDEAARHPGVVFIDSWPMFTTREGAYADYLRTAAGDLLLMRQADGIHLTLAGASRLGSAIVARIAHDYHVPAPQ